MASRFRISLDDEQGARLKSYAETNGVSLGAVVGAIADRLPTPESNAAGRPDTGPRSNQVLIRLSDNECLALDEHVEATGFDTRTSWATRVVVHGINQVPAMSREELTELRRSRSELAAIGRNLNQIARALNIDSTNERPSDALITKTLELVDAHDDAIAALVNKVEMRGQR